MKCEFANMVLNLGNHPLKIKEYITKKLAISIVGAVIFVNERKISSKSF